MTRALLRALAGVAISLTASASPLPTIAVSLAAQQPLDGFDAYVARAVQDWDVPGLAIAVVKDDSVVFAKGYGVRTLGTADRVDTHTLFANASTTKAFVALAVLMLADSGRLTLDDRVTRWLPGFQLYDPWVTRELTVRDLLTHRSGLPEADFLWYDQPADWSEIARRLRYVKPATSFRSHFAYQNETYAAAGFVAQAASGVPWERLLQQRIFAPLGMRETYTNTQAAAAQRNIATPHFPIDDTVHAIARYYTDNIGPAGAMYSSVSDMARWVRFLLDSARVGGRRLLSAAQFAELWRPQMIVGEDEFYPTQQLTHPHFTGYGLGWFLEDYHGEWVAFHTGSIDGFSAIVGLVPDRRLGVVIFANRDHAELRHALMYTVFDRYLGGGTHDWSAEMLTLYRGLRDKVKAAEQKQDEARVPNTTPSLPLERYAGTYRDSLYGEARVRVERGALVLELSPQLVGDLQHWNYDTFRVVWRNRWLGKQLVSFRLGMDGAVTAIDLGEGVTLMRVGEVR